MVDVPNGNQAARGLSLAGTNTPASEMYGTMGVYLRLKGIVPPTTDGRTRRGMSRKNSPGFSWADTAERPDGRQFSLSRTS
jgi:hypothetical protein